MTSPNTPKDEVVEDFYQEEGEEEEDDYHPVIDDAIGDTMYSKVWIRGVIRKTIEFFKNKKEEDEEVYITSIETELCALWDMTTERAVQEFLLEDDLFEFFKLMLITSEFCRLKEISLGVLANLMHHETICRRISGDQPEQFHLSVLSLLSQSDVPLLTQLFRLLITALSAEKSAQVWHIIIQQNAGAFFEDVQKVLVNCLNVDLLKLAFDLVSRLLNDGKSTFGIQGGENEQIISALCTAFTTILDATLPSEEKDATEEEMEVNESSKESWTGVSVSNTAFLRHFWRLINGLCPAYFVSINFSPEELHRLIDLFLHFNLLLAGDDLNCLLAFAVACTFFAELCTINTRLLEPKAEQQQVELFKEEIKLLLRRLAKNSQLAGSLHRAIQLTETAFENEKKTETENSSNVLENLEYALECMQRFNEVVMGNHNQQQ